MRMPCTRSLSLYPNYCLVALTLFFDFSAFVMNRSMSDYPHSGDKVRTVDCKLEWKVFKDIPQPTQACKVIRHALCTSVHVALSVHVHISFCVEQLFLWLWPVDVSVNRVGMISFRTRRADRHPPAGVGWLQPIPRRRGKLHNGHLTPSLFDYCACNKEISKLCSLHGVNLNSFKANWAACLTWENFTENLELTNWMTER